MQWRSHDVLAVYSDCRRRIVANPFVDVGFYAQFFNATFEQAARGVDVWASGD